MSLRKKLIICLSRVEGAELRCFVGCWHSIVLVDKKLELLSSMSNITSSRVLS